MRTLPNDPRGLLALLLTLAAPPLAAQAPAAAAPAGQVAAAAPAAALPAGDVYRREVFRYLRGGRPDPFAPLLTAAELGFRVEDLRLTSIIYSPEARRSIAVFAEGNGARRYRLHQGQRLGTMTVLRVWPRRVDVRVDEFGGSRLQTIVLERAQRQEEAAQTAATQAAPGGQQQFPVTITQPAPQEPAQRVLRRGTAAVQRGVSAGAPTPAPAPAPAQPARGVNPRSPNYTTQTRP